MSRESIPVIRPYNPLAKRNLGESVAMAMLSSPVHELPPQPFVGAGVYAIYYRGDFEPYKKLAEYNKDEWRVPIYVGKAVPAGARKGGLGMDVDHGLALQKRLTDHYNSIAAVSNLNEEDFACRFLVVDDIWIPLAESMMIERFKPLWNRCLDGFGNHDPGAGRAKQQRSPWDCIHEGRLWANKLSPCAKSKDQLLAEISEYLDNYELR